MSMTEFRGLATKIEQHMQQLAAKNINEPHLVIHHMMGYVTDLHKIWVGTSDEQLMALSREFPNFYRYAFMMEEAAEAEHHKASRSYDGMARFSEPHKVMATQLLTTAATLERGYQAFIGCGNLKFFQPQLDEMNGLYRQWLVDLEKFKASLRAFGADPKMLAYVNEAFGQIAERLKKLAEVKFG